MKRFLSIKGRINRSELLYTSMFLLVFETILFYFLNDKSTAFILISSVVTILYLMQCAKRYHDLNKWGINGFVWFIVPIANIFYFIQLYFIKGTNVANKYGEASSFNFKNVLGQITKLYKSTKTNLSKKELESHNPIEIKENKIDQYNFNENKELKHESEEKTNFIKVKLWLKKDGDYCKIGDEICTVNYTESQIYPEETLYSNKNGFLQIKKQCSVFTKNSIDELFEVNYNANNYFKSTILEDKFNNCKNLKWEIVGGNKHSENRINGFFLTLSNNYKRLFFSLNNIGGNDYIVINYPKKDYEIKKGDRFQILLETEQIINLSFIQNSYEVYESSNDTLKKILENKVAISFPDLESLARYKITNWKLTFQSGQEIVGINPYLSQTHEYNSFEKLQVMVLLLAKEYIEIVQGLENYKPLTNYNSINNSLKETCFIYLMIDRTNSYYKIGISNKPEYRERTLQSEKPTIELIASKEFPNRKIAESFEKALHNSFKEKNIRGEWFMLDKDDIDDLIESLK